MKTEKRPPNFVVLAVGLAFALALTVGCSSSDETAEATLIGSAVTDNVFFFYAEVDNSLVSSCGSSTPQTTTTGSTGTGSTSEGGSSGSGTTQTPTRFKIASFYVFNNKVNANFTIPQTATMLLKYNYSTTQDSFSLTPTSSAVSTCATSDFIKCDTNGVFTCNTTDNQTCGGENSFIFSNTLATPSITFEAYTGTINWKQGFNLNSDNTAVSSATLELSVLNQDGTAAFVGSVTCVYSEQ